MCNTADKLSQSLDFLRLQQRCLGPFATRYFFTELAIGPLKVRGSLGHQAFEHLRRVALTFEVRACFILPPSGAFSRNNSRLKRNGLQGTLKEAHVAQALDYFS